MTGPRAAGGEAGRPPPPARHRSGSAPSAAGWARPASAAARRCAGGGLACASGRMPCRPAARRLGRGRPWPLLARALPAAGPADWGQRRRREGHRGRPARPWKRPLPPRARGARRGRALPGRAPAGRRGGWVAGPLGPRAVRDDGRPGPVPRAGIPLAGRVAREEVQPGWAPARRASPQPSAVAIDERPGPGLRGWAGPGPWAARGPSGRQVRGGSVVAVPPPGAARVGWVAERIGRWAGWDGPAVLDGRRSRGAPGGGAGWWEPAGSRVRVPARRGPEAPPREPAGSRVVAEARQRAPRRPGSWGVNGCPRCWIGPGRRGPARPEGRVVAVGGPRVGVGLVRRPGPTLIGRRWEPLLPGSRAQVGGLRGGR